MEERYFNEKDLWSSVGSLDPHLVARRCKTFPVLTLKQFYRPDTTLTIFSSFTNHQSKCPMANFWAHNNKDTFPAHPTMPPSPTKKGDISMRIINKTKQNNVIKKTMECTKNSTLCLISNWLIYKSTFELTISAHHKMIFQCGHRLINTISNTSEMIIHVGIG